MIPSSASVTLEPFYRLGRCPASAASLEQVRVELAAADAIAHRMVVAVFDFATADQACAKASDGLAHVLSGIVG